MRNGWGPTDVRKHTWWKSRGHHLRIIVRDEDVTERCRFFDDTCHPPVAELLRRTPEGHVHMDEGGIVAVQVEHEFTIVDTAP